MAIADYTHAIELNPQHAPAYNSRSKAFDARGEFDRVPAQIMKRPSRSDRRRRRRPENDSSLHEVWIMRYELADCEWFAIKAVAAK